MPPCQPSREAGGIHHGIKVRRIPRKQPQPVIIWCLKPPDGWVSTKWGLFKSKSDGTLMLYPVIAGDVQLSLLACDCRGLHTHPTPRTHTPDNTHSYTHPHSISSCQMAALLCVPLIAWCGVLTGYLQDFYQYAGISTYACNERERE